MGEEGGLTRRQTLAGAGGLAAVAAAGVAGWELFGDDPQRPPAETIDEETSQTLAERFAPELQFGAGERWFPVDPAPYASQGEEGRVVSGFDAFDGYAAQLADGAVEPTVFYRVVRYEGTDLAVVQYWLYSAFDQFSVNFHWHDWELLQVFVDLGADGTAGESVDPTAAEPTLFVASAHSRKVPNNEFLDPEVERPSVISEVGSHSSALGVNQTRRRFERFEFDGGSGDVTNPILATAELPFAYGLPRDEGVRLPYLVPELDGAPIYEHDRLPNVDRGDLVPESITVDAFDTLSEPPTDLPERSHGRTLRFEGAEAAADTPADGGDVGATYRLAGIEQLEDIEAFTGPQLSFPFAVPEFGEDLVASHITTTGVPWEQPRYVDPVSDVTDPDHIQAVADRFELPEPTGPTAIATRLLQAAESDEAPGANGISTATPDTGGVALLESDPVAVPTIGDSVVVLDPEPGDHRLTVNAPGVAPYSERLQHGADDAGTARTTDGATATTSDSETAETAEETESETATAAETSDGAGPRATELAGVTQAGADGRTVVVPNADAVKLEVDGDGLARVAVTDDFGGRVYDGRPDESGRDAVYAHSAGAYTTDVEDADGQPGAYRINPAAEQRRATVESAETGKRSLAAYLETFLRETEAQARAIAAGDDPDDAVPADARDPATDRDEPIGSATATPTPDGTDEGGGPPDDGGDQPSGLDVLLGRLENALGAAQNALRAANDGDGPAADRQLGALRNRLDAIERTIQAGPDELPAELVTLVERRLGLLRERVQRAIDAE